MVLFQKAIDYGVDIDDINWRLIPTTYDWTCYTYLSLYKISLFKSVCIGFIYTFLNTYEREYSKIYERNGIFGNRAFPNAF